MKLKARLTAEELSTLPEDLAENYTEAEVDGEPAFLLTVEGVEHEHQVKGLKTALGRERENYGQAKVTIAQLKKNLQALETRANQPPEDTDDVKALRKQAETYHTLLKREMTERSIVEAIVEHKAVPAGLKSLLRERVKFGEENGEGFTYVEVGDKKMAVSTYVGKLRDAATNKKDPLYQEGLGSLFYGRMASGGGTPPNGGGAGATPAGGGIPHRGQMSARQKVDFIKANGQQAYMDLPK